MLASDFINHRTKILRAHHRGILDARQFLAAMFCLFQDALVSRGIVDDAKISWELYAIYVKENS